MNQVKKSPQDTAEQLNIRRLLSRLEIFLKKETLLYIDAGEAQKEALSLAKKSNWQCTDDLATAHVALFYYPGEKIPRLTYKSTPNIKALLAVGENAEQNIHACFKKADPIVTPHKHHQPLQKFFDQWSQSWAEKWRTLFQEKWSAFGFTETVGARLAAFPLKGTQEVFLNLQAPIEPPKEKTKKDHFYLFAVTTGKIGLLPIMPGTMASVLSLFLAILGWIFLPSYGVFWILHLLIFHASSLVSFLAEGWAEKHFRVKDPREFVLDETAGMSLTLLCLPQGLWMHHKLLGIFYLLLAFFAFRFFDIFKIGVHWIEERKWKGSILWDDLLAGLYAGLVIWILAQPFA